MAKTPAELDRDIRAALERGAAPSTEGNYYYVADRGKHRTLYGPYAEQRDAELAGYFHKPVAERDSTPARIFFMRGVQEFDENEVASLTRDPQEWGFKSVKVMRRVPPMHASWRAFDAEFREYLRSHDQERADLR